mmetsp:Transcript_74528/g.149981  ORF Transcript_74528/g.149981 Transcript_74528/m.149981 type:complete len:223 (+) Transcript_74528:3652-4320(+)
MSQRSLNAACRCLVGGRVAKASAVRAQRPVIRRRRARHTHGHWRGPRLGGDVHRARGRLGESAEAANGDRHGAQRFRGEGHGVSARHQRVAIVVVEALRAVAACSDYGHAGHVVVLDVHGDGKDPGKVVVGHSLVALVRRAQCVVALRIRVRGRERELDSLVVAVPLVNKVVHRCHGHGHRRVEVEVREHHESWAHCHLATCRHVSHGHVTERWRSEGHRKR